MKYLLYRIVSIVLIIHTFGYANIDAQIDAIKNASIQERFKLMNKFKKDLIKMKEAQRMKAIEKLTKNANKKNVKKALEKMQEINNRIRLQRKIESHHVEESNMATETNYQGDDDD